MKNLWGSDDRGPGGDPSWLGGKDRGAGSQGSGGWSSDFDDGAQRPDPDFGGGDVGGGDVSAGGFGGRDAQAESMAPRFGDVTGDDARTKEADAHWSESFTGQRTEGSRRGRSGLSRALGAVLPIVVLLIIGFAFAKVFGSGGLHGFSAWWIFMFIGLPFLNRLIRRIRKHLDD